MKEYSIGRKIRREGKTLLICESNHSCEGCFYYNPNNLLIDCSSVHKCDFNVRSDEKNVIYKRLSKWKK